MLVRIASNSRESRVTEEISKGAPQATAEDQTFFKALKKVYPEEFSSVTRRKILYGNNDRPICLNESHALPSTSESE